MEFEPFDRVMVRNIESLPWTLAYYDHLDSPGNHVTDHGIFTYCKPFDKEEYLSQFSNYESNQQKWLKETGVKLRSIVQVCRKANSHENNWLNSWNQNMDATVGLIGEVIMIGTEGGIKIKFFNTDKQYFYPYFVLSVIKK